jgi:hypothetical protein
MVARNRGLRKRARLENQRKIRCSIRSIGGRGRAMLGAPGRSRTAHVVQLWPVGIERRLGKFAPEGADVVKQAGLPVAARRLGQGCCREAGHDGACLILPQLLSKRALEGAGGSFGRQSLRECLNCRRRLHTWYPAGNDPRERTGNTAPAVALSGPRRYISASKSFTMQRFRGSRWLASSSIS